MHNYRVILRPEPEGGYSAFVPALPGCFSSGSTIDDSLSNIQEAIELYLESLAETGDSIPNDNDTLEYNLTIHG